MKMDEDNRPDEASAEEESDAGWYFDLPKGAWERQEAKNRELRQSVRRNMDAEPPKRDAFGPREDGRDLRQEEEPPSWRALHGDEPAEADDLKWSLPDSSDDDQPAEVEYSTEPEAPLDLPLSLRSQRMPDEEPPAIKPPAGLFGHTEEASWTADEEDTPPEAAAEPRIVRRFAADQDDERPVPFVRGDMPPPAPVEQPQSRWGEIFSEKAADGASMLDSMRAWAKSAEARNQDDGDFDGDEQPAMPTSFETTAEEPAASLPSASQPITPDDLPIRVQHHDEDEPPLVNADNPTTRWDQMFARKASDDAGLLEGMRAWATKPEDDEDAGPPRMRLSPETEEVDESLFKPFEWEQDSQEAAPPAREGAHYEPEPAEKKGFLGRLFGKKKPDDVEEPSTRHGDPWAAADEAPEDFPGRLSFGRDEEPRGSWLGRSDGDENRFGSAEPERTLQWADIARQPQPPADSPWALDEEPATAAAEPSLDDSDEWEPEPAADGAGIPFDALKEPAPTMEPATGVEDEPLTLAAAPPVAEARSDENAAREPWDPFASLKTDDDAGWDPEPFEPAPAAAADDDPYALRTALQPATDEDPWRSVDAVEQEASPAAADWQPPAPAEANATPEAPADPGDPWAVYMAGRTEDEPDTSASVPTASIEERDMPEAHVEDSAPEFAADEEAPEEDSPWPAVAATAAAAGAVVAAAPDGFDSPAGGVNDSSAEGSLWDSAFARVHDEQLAEETPAEDVSPPEDDPWAAIAEASGVEPGSGEIAIFRGTADVEDALERYEAEREAEEAITATDAEALSDEFDEAAAVNLPAWDDSKVEDDTVLRAFQAHAALYEDDAAPDEMPEPANDTETIVFDDLLGEDADEIVAEASQQPVENKYFGRMQGWAPQRSPAERQAFPWETETQPERLRPPGAADAMDDDEEPVLEGWSRVEEPPAPWTHTTAAAHTDAPSVRRKSRSRMLVREIVETGLLALLVFLAVRASFQNFKVDGLSMYPTLEDGEYLIVNKLAYAEVDMDRLGNFVPFVDPGEDPTREVFGGPERGDIVVLEDPREEDTDLIKRIIALPGETIEIIDGEVYINDFLLEEPYIKQEWDDTKAKILIPEGYYFVMGDNRSNSLDSRSADIGLISKELIIGKAALTYWPRNKFGLAPNGGGDISDEDGPPIVTTQRLDD